MDASEPKWVNYILNVIRVNSLRLGDLQITYALISRLEKCFFVNIYIDISRNEKNEIVLIINMNLRKLSSIFEALTLE